MSELGMRKVQIPSIITSPEREAPKTSTKRAAALRSRTGITFGYLSRIYSNKRGRQVYTTFTSGQNAAYSPAYSHKFFPPLGRLCSGRFYIFTEQMWFQPLVSHWEVMAHISIYCVFCLWSTGFALWCKSIFFDLFWCVKLFSSAE